MGDAVGVRVGVMVALLSIGPKLQSGKLPCASGWQVL